MKLSYISKYSQWIVFPFFLFILIIERGSKPTFVNQTHPSFISSRSATKTLYMYNPIILQSLTGQDLSDLKAMQL